AFRAERRRASRRGGAATDGGRGDRAHEEHIRCRGRGGLMPQPNMNKMLKQVQQMQAEMVKAQEQLKHEVVEASAGGGMVTVKVTGDLEVKEIVISPDALGGEGEAPSPEDYEMLQD